jgi:hypothetical protein
MGMFGKLEALNKQQQQQKTPHVQSPTDRKPPIEKPKTEKEKTSLHANQQTSKDASMQTSKHANQFIDLHANQQTGKDANLLSTKEKRKYSTYLTEESVLAIQMKAIQTKRKDHEIVQEAIDRYFANE